MFIYLNGRKQNVKTDYVLEEARKAGVASLPDICTLWYEQNVSLHESSEMLILYFEDSLYPMTSFLLSELSKEGRLQEIAYKYGLYSPGMAQEAVYHLESSMENGSIESKAWLSQSYKRATISVDIGKKGLLEDLLQAVIGKAETYMHE